MTHKFEPRVPDAKPGQDGWGSRVESDTAPAAQGPVCGTCGCLEDDAEHKSLLKRKLGKK